MMRTSTGSIRVTKIIQKKNMRSGNRKKTIANAERTEIEILPSEITSAMTRLLTSILHTAAFDPVVVPAPRTCE